LQGVSVEEPKIPLANIQAPKVKANADTTINTSALRKESADENGFTQKPRMLRPTKDTATKGKENSESSALARSPPDILAAPSDKKTRTKPLTDITDSPFTTEASSSAQRSKKRGAAKVTRAVLNSSSESDDDDDLTMESPAPAKKKSKKTEAIEIEPEDETTETTETALFSPDKRKAASKKPQSRVNKPAKATSAKITAKTTIAQAKKSGKALLQLAMAEDDEYDDDDDDLSSVVEKIGESAKSAQREAEHRAEEAVAKELKKEILDLQARSKRNVALIDDLEQEKRSYLADNEELKKKVEELQRASEARELETKKEISALKRDVARLEAQLVSERETRESLEAELAVHKEGADSTSAEYESIVDGWKKNCEKIVEKAKRYQQSAKETSEELEATKQELETTKEALEETVQAMEQINLEIHELKRLEAHREKVSTDKGDRKTKEPEEKKDKEIMRLRSANEKLQAEISNLRNQKQPLSPNNESLTSWQDKYKAAKEAADQLLQMNQLSEELTAQLQADLEKAKQDRITALDVAKAEGQLADELQKQLLELQEVLRKTEKDIKKAEDKASEQALSSSTTVPPLQVPKTPFTVDDWLESPSLGPLENFMNIQLDPENDSRWTLTCRNVELNNELQFTLEILEDSLEYVPLDYKNGSTAGDPSHLPDFLRRPIYFKPSMLASFIAKMIAFLHKSNKKADER
jgi:hypothetical protein